MHKRMTVINMYEKNVMIKLIIMKVRNVILDFIAYLLSIII